MTLPKKFGFSWMEVAVAFFVGVIAVGAVVQTISKAEKNWIAAQKLQLAAELAEEKLLEGLAEKTIAVGWENGDFPQHPGMDWSREVTLIEPPHLYQIRLYLNWEGAKGKELFELATYYLAPASDERSL